MFQQVAAGVYAVHNRFVAGKCGIVLGERWALAIDAGNYPEEGAAMAAFICEAGHDPDRLALTHGHGDHILGGEAFREAQIVAHVTTPDVIARQVPGWATRWGVPPDEVRRRLIRPNTLFSHDVEIDLGGKHVCLFHAPGHSEDGVCALVVEEHVLFAGDTVVTGILPAFADGDSRVLERTLYRLAALEIEVLVSGHGPVMRGADAVRRWLVETAAYLARTRRLVARGVAAGQADGRILQDAAYVQLVGDRLPRDQHHMEERHANAVRAIIDECRRVAPREP